MTPLEHLRNRRYLDAYVDGELSGALADRVGRHVAACPRCGADAELTLHMKHSLARRRTLPERVMRRLGLRRRCGAGR